MSTLQPAPWTMRKAVAKEVAGFLYRELKSTPEYQKSVEKESDVESSLEKWTLVGFFSGDEVFGVLGCDAEGLTHVHIAQAWQHLWQARSSFTRAFALLFTEHEQLTASFARDNESAKKICQLFGWRLVGDDGKDLTFILSKADLQESTSYRT